ncbi:uncharacterized protein LOC128992693 isoform X2 [Macrosteles quadrilineatus]|uniref:uncharacterized protein LOC128992693 isoform X2 n=1 Tax=Macrosteles quadrilineatus TaxID=74068 RepID=UPI0023E0F043|nr:uncharacterized protein LOC128992693 isoform X2 [Macrosteles quadrilineatus]
MMVLGPADSTWPPCRRRSPPRPPPPHTRKRWRRRKERHCWWRASQDSSSSSEDEPTHPSYSYHSDTETNMPCGFENSAMKSSFSLSSLQPSSTNLESPEHARVVERPYNSLRKTCRRERDAEKDSWRRSWDRREVTNDQFWNALEEPNYLYLMDCNLIDSCKEVRNDLHYSCSPSHDWSFDQFCAQFTELDQWLTSIQETIYNKEENVTDRNLRLSHIEEMHHKTYKRKVFNNQGGRLAAKFPGMKDEVKRRMTHLNRKWERLEQTVTPRKHSRVDTSHLEHLPDVEHLLNCLRKWLRLTERKLQPINFRVTWTLAELEAKAKEHQGIQRQVEFLGRSVSSVLKQCDLLVQAEAEKSREAEPPDTQGRRRGRLDAAQAVRTAKDLQRRWQHLTIRSLEWQCHIDNQTKRAEDKEPEVASPLDSDEGEPVHKHPRLGSSPWHSSYDQDDDGDYLMEQSSCSTNDMVGPQSELASLPPTFPTATSPTLLVRSGTTEEDLLNDNYTLYDRRQGVSVPLDAARKLFSDESSIFTSEPTSLGKNSSDRPAQNCATFYFKHCDTESEQEDRGRERETEETEPVAMDTDNNKEDSSEEEWTYKCGEDSAFTHSTETLASAPRSTKPESQPLPKPQLQKLIEGAVEIVHSSPSRPRTFPPLIFETARARSKVSDWMMRAWDPEDCKGESCDASGEYTTEEEERQSSGDFNHSAFLPSHNSTEVLSTLDTTLTEKHLPVSPVNVPEHFKISPVVLRAKRKEGTPKRPLSESGLPQIVNGDEKLLQCRSESALHQIDHTPTQSVKMDTSVHTTLSSSTVEETVGGQTQEGSCGGYSSNSLRRRKIKMRKRNLGKKSESGSDNHDPPSPLKSPHAVARRVASSGTETEEDAEVELRNRIARRKCSTTPNFKLGPEGLVTVFSTAEKALSADSSFSEQAWDNYQEKYMSEAYSEDAPDQETARRLLEFGEDYRNFLDSQSDGGASSLGLGRGGYLRRRKYLAVDSDSGGPELQNLIATSLSQLKHSEMAWSKLSKANPLLVMAKDFAEIISICKDNISALKCFLDKSEQGNGYIEECREMKGMMEQWHNLRMRTDELERMRSLQREMVALRVELADLTSRVADTRSDTLEDRDQLELKIVQVKTEQANLRERKAQLVEVNSAVHKFFTDSAQSEAGLQAAQRLKEDINELYYVWDETNKRVSEQLDSLSQLSATWQTLESQLTELTVALRSDQQTLRMLDSALRDGVGVQNVASSVIDVAKVLSEKQDLRSQSLCALNATTPVILVSEGCPESDSGISDSGSELESERERRLSALRRLAHQLDTVLSPNSQAIKDITRRIDEAETELRLLQNTCRKLIVKVALSEDHQTSSLRTSTSSLAHKSDDVDSGPMSFMPSDPDSDPDRGSSTRGWLWRVFRASVPFHIALLVILCVGYLLEPQCCDRMLSKPFFSIKYPNGVAM